MAERAELTKKELADAAYLESVIKRAKRGERLPGQTMLAIQRRFPELGRRLRALVEETTAVDKGLRAALKQNEAYIKSLRAEILKAKAGIRLTPAVVTQLKPAKAVTVERVAPPEPVVVPDEVKITEAFKLMEYEDRLAFRNTMDSQLQEIGEMIAEQERELEGTQEFLRTDPVASYTAKEIKYTTKKGKEIVRKYDITAVLTEGKMPETLTPAKAKYLLMGRELKPGAFDKAGQVRWEYIIDELADYFHMGEQELVNKIEQIVDMKQKAEDLAVMIQDANNRVNGLKRMLTILTNIESNPQNITPAEPVAIEPTTPEAEAVAPEAIPQRTVEVKDARREKHRSTAACRS